METFSWLFEICLGVLLLLAAQYGIKAALSRFDKQHPKGWKSKLTAILKQPLFFLLWTLATLYFIDVVLTHSHLFSFHPYLRALQKTAFVTTLAWILYRWKREVEKNLHSHPSQKIDSTTVRIIGRLATITLILLATLFILQVFGINTTPLLTLGGVGAASIGFASKDVIANFCSGIMLHFSRPFLVGDLVLLPEKNLEGHIEAIGWMKTTLRDKEKRPVYLPNNLFSTLLLINISRMTHRRLKQLLQIKFSDLNHLSTALSHIKTHLEASPDIDRHYPIHVSLQSFGDYAGHVDIDAYSTLTNLQAFNQLQQTLLLDFVAILQKLDIHLAIPMLHVEK